MRHEKRHQPAGHDRSAPGQRRPQSPVRDEPADGPQSDDGARDHLLAGPGGVGSAGADDRAPYDPLQVDATRTLEPPSACGTGSALTIPAATSTAASLGRAYHAARRTAFISAVHPRRLDSRAHQRLLRGSSRLPDPAADGSVARVSRRAAGVDDRRHARRRARQRHGGGRHRGRTNVRGVVYGSVLSAKQDDYVEAARVIGCRDLRIILRHVAPAILPPVIVLATLQVAAAIFAASSLSFIGLGAQPPTPEWGAMVSRGRYALRSAWWMSTFPGWPSPWSLSRSMRSATGCVTRWIPACAGVRCGQPPTSKKGGQKSTSTGDIS